MTLIEKYNLIGIKIESLPSYLRPRETEFLELRIIVKIEFRKQFINKILNGNI